MRRLSALSVKAPLGRGVKRVLDVVLATTGIVVLLPLFIVLAVLVRLDSPGPVLFRQERVGHRGRLFRIWKFRTMVDGAEGMGPGVTASDDARVTAVGRWLRGTKLDELPQLINVVHGSMSLVGPRPELPRYVALYSPEERAVLSLRPGITDPATLAYRDEEEILSRAPDPQRHYEDVVMRDKIRVNLEYAGRATPLTDLVIVFRTVRTVVRPRLS